MPPRENDVELLQLRGSREYDVRIARRVSEKLFAYHREEIFALQASDNLVLFRDNNRGIGVVDEQGFNGRIELVFVEERRTEAPLIEHARAGLDPIRPHQVFPFYREGPNWQLQNAAPDPAPRPDEGRKTCGRAHRLAATGMTLDRDADTDHARLSGRVFARERPDVLRRNPGDLRNHLRRVGTDALLELVKAGRVVLDVIVVDKVLAEY